MENPEKSSKPRISRKGQQGNAVAALYGPVGSPGAPIDWDAAMKAGIVAPLAAKIAANSGAYRQVTNSMITALAPKAVGILDKIMSGKVKGATASDRLAAVKLVLTYHQGASGIDALRNGQNLTEASLDQLETILRGSLEAVLDAKAIDSTAFRAPTQGAQGAEAPGSSAAQAQEEARAQAPGGTPPGEGEVEVG